MSGAQTDQTLVRLDAAITRIEAALTRPVLRPVAEADQALAARHETLRQAVAESLRDLDGLIAEADQVGSASQAATE